mgnify:CR=1 FL=1
METEKQKNPVIPFLVGLVGAIISVVANFIPYVEVNGLFFSYKMSFSQIILAALENPELELSTSYTITAFCFLVFGFVCTLLILLFALLKKGVPMIIFAILSLAPLLVITGIWLHIVGACIVLIGAIWLLATKKQTA